MISVSFQYNFFIQISRDTPETSHLWIKLDATRRILKNGVETLPAVTNWHNHPETKPKIIICTILVPKNQLATQLPYQCIICSNTKRSSSPKTPPTNYTQLITEPSISEQSKPPAPTRLAPQKIQGTVKNLHRASIMAFPYHSAHTKTSPLFIYYIRRESLNSTPLGRPRGRWNSLVPFPSHIHTPTRTHVHAFINAYS